MRLAFFSMLLFLGFIVHAQTPAYWQQQVNYTIQVSLDDQKHQLDGTVSMEYSNNSPDKLDFIWFHLWPNAYKNETTAFARQLLRDEDGKKRLKGMKDKGAMEGLDFTVNDVKAGTEADPENIDIIKLILPKPLAPGEKAVIKTPFRVKLASYTSRSGHDGQNYMVCQWYPKPAVYDRKGWHPIPYLDQGEFYSEFGNFDVSITLPSSYIVGATGELQNAAELKQYKDMGRSNVAAHSRKNVIKYQPQAGTKTLAYKITNAHDFAWFADKEFVVRYDTLQLEQGRTIDVFTYHHPDGNKNWINSTDYVKSGARAYSGYLGTYSYPVVQAVEGPKNDMSGGMEYPTITLITSPSANEEVLDAVITHEVGHNWFYGMLASNERDHAWMDEGLNSYFQFRYEAEKFRGSSIFGDKIPKELKQKSAADFQAAIYNAMSQIPMDEAIETRSADFNNKDAYGLVEYVKTAIWMYVMELYLGRPRLDAAMQTYFNEWKFRHPYPEDMRKSLESNLKEDLSPYFDLLNKKGGL
jgi:hypothetical protein